MPELYIGLMSGTSADGIDAALVDFANNPFELLDCVFHPYDDEIKTSIRLLSECNNKIVLTDFGKIDTQLGHLFAEAANTLLIKNNYAISSIQAIGSHGQTLCHSPSGPFPFSLQIGDPNIIAERTGIPTVADFRRRDIACNGQGAPLVPGFHQAVFGHPTIHRCIVNIGGIANITVLPAKQDPYAKATGFDTGPGNALMDEWILKHKKQSFDRDGDWAKTGTIDYRWVEQLMQDAYFKLQPPKSTGKDYFSLSWLEPFLASGGYLAENVQASLCYLTATSICDDIKKHAPKTQEVLVCGGGVHNSLLMTLLRDNLTCPVASTSSFGIDPDYVEAMAFAWLARQTLTGLPGNLTEVTGAQHARCLGGVYRGN